MDPQRLTIDELGQLLNASDKELRKWIGDGLPWTSTNPRRRRFDKSECFFDCDQSKEWLLIRRYIEPPPEKPVLKSVRDLASYLGVTQQRVYQMLDSDCPREADGSFNVEHVEAWRESRRAESNANSETAKAKAQHETDLARIKAEDAQLDLDEKRGKLIDVETPAKIFIKHIAEVKSHLKQIPSLAVSFMPTKSTSAEKKRMQVEIQKKLDELHAILEQGCRDWATNTRKGLQLE